MLTAKYISRSCRKRSHRSAMKCALRSPRKTKSPVVGASRALGVGWLHGKALHPHEHQAVMFTGGKFRLPQDHSPLIP